ncbi:nuclear transport factor 2 family protein [Amycolatopsis nigrescens]|uniref:nuclear transport factor 2 family protein n=1 Tax=Amycolatopsis nigrescens TaxID=381445 RepID=UPI00036F9635|nr:nuclear transport factor 2 family protein [Amycolatopsis nigrescens]
MYKMIVAGQVRKAFQALNRGEYGSVTDQLAPGAVYEFVGDHALGGRRSTPEVILAGFTRMFEIFEAGRFDVVDVLVKGTPWRTRVISIVDITATVAGEPYRNRMIQVLDLKWARITAIYSLEDTQHLAAVLDRAASRGVRQAAAAPLFG